MKLLQFMVVVSCWAWAAGAAPVPAPNSITFIMPQDGWATVAINNADGRRVRNLFANLPFQAREHRVEWDGRDDAGELLPAGAYQWTGLYRNDIEVLYRGAYQHGKPPWLYGKTGGWAGDHSSVQAVAAIGDQMFLASNESEWGHGLIGSDLDGNKRWGLKWLNRRAWCGGEALAVVGDRLFATSYLGECAVWEVITSTGQNDLVLIENDIPENVRSGKKPHLRVVGGRKTAEGGELFLADHGAKRTLVFRVPETYGEKLAYLRTLPLHIWSIAFLADGRAVAALDHSVEILDPASGATKPFTQSPISAPWSVAVDAQGRVYVSDQGASPIHQFTRHGQMSHRFTRLDRPASHQIKIFDSHGKLLHALGREGGRVPGKFDAESFFQPAGIAVDSRGRLWVSEFSQSPKRVSVWDIPATGAPKLSRQFVGPAHYGGGGAMIDPKKPWEIMDTNFGVVFNVDLEKQSFEVDRVPWVPIDFWKEHGHQPDRPFAGRPGVVIEMEGRRYSALQGGYMHGDDTRWSPHFHAANGLVAIGEYVNDEFIPRAAAGSILSWMRGRSLNTRREEQWLAKPIIEAARQLPKWNDYAKRIGMEPNAPDVPHWEHKRGAPFYTAVTWPAEIGGVLWTDANGDGRMQAGEIQFYPIGHDGRMSLDRNLNIYWSIPEWQGKLAHVGESVVGSWKLPRTGFNAIGAPVYDISAITRLGDWTNEVVHHGEDGSMLSLTSLRGPDGVQRWSYPADSKGIKSLGKDSRKVLRPGSVHRAVAVQGVVEGPGELGDVYMLQSTDGMKYLLTRDDGLFITMVFRPYAFADGWDSIAEAVPGTRLDQHSLQDECFNAHFVRAEASGHGFEKGRYYLIGNSRSAVTEVTGLDTVRRFAGGGVNLVAGTGLYGKEEKLDPAAQAAPPVVQRTVTPLTARRGGPGIDLLSGKDIRWNDVHVNAGYDGRGVHFKWQVRGVSSIFVNKGADWTQIFSTGDGVDIQFRTPKLGKLRFVAAMHNDEPVIVRMRYEGTDAESAVTYRSDVHTRHVAAVDIIQRGYSVRRGKDNYVLQFLIPWDQIGFDSQPPISTELPMELGVLYASPDGTRTQRREFWAGGTGTGADLPAEADPTESWGKLILGNSE